MRAKDKCPSCFQPVAPTDFLCANCELILDPSQAPERPVGDVSVVRRMLEAPQRGVPSNKPTRPPKPAPSEGLEGPTRRLDLGPELSGVPVVVATLTGKSVQLNEFEAWVVSQIDGLSDAGALAKRAGVREFELRVVLRTLHEKHIIDFADEPLSDADLDMPSVMGTLDEDAELATAPGIPEAPNLGANSDRRDGRFMAPPSRASVPPMPDPLPAAPAPVRAAAPPRSIPPMPDPAPPAPPITGQKAPVSRARHTAAPPPGRASLESARDERGAPPDFVEREHTPIVQGRAEPPVLTPVGGRGPVKAPVPYPAMTAAERAGLPPSRAVGSAARTAPPPPPPDDDAASPPPPPRPERTDPRIAYSGAVNRKVLDALKKVKRVDAATSPAPAAPREEKVQPLADVLARDTLQVALRMEQGGRLDEAIRFLEKSIAQSPEAASLYNRLGIILMRERADYRRAETLIRKAIELAPDNTVYSTNLRQVLSQQAMRSHR
jgi:hypothetical protein